GVASERLEPRNHERSALAAGAEPGTAACDPRLRDRRPATWTWLAAAPVDFELVLHRARCTFRRAVVAQRRSLSCDARVQRATDAAMKFAELAAVEFPRRPSGIDSCPPQRLVGVDVPYARQNALVEEEIGRAH